MVPLETHQVQKAAQKVNRFVCVFSQQQEKRLEAGEGQGNEATCACVAGRPADMIVAFVVDVHESMGEVYPPSAPPAQSSSQTQRGVGVAPIEWAKIAIDAIIKDRRDRRRQNDQYLLLSTEEGPHCVKSSWGDPRPRFDEQLKAMTPVKAKPTSLSYGMSTALALMNQYRLPRGVDNYGQGRNPWMLELGALIVLTDSDSCGGQQQPQQGDSKGGGGGVKKLLMTCSPQPGAELTKEPYRWDQRIFIMMMQRATTPGPPVGNIGNVGLLRNLAEMTGGVFSVCSSLPKLLESTSNACKKLASMGGVVGFVPADGADQVVGNTLGGGGPGGSSSHHHHHHLPTRGLISVGHELTSTTNTWPIPEAFWIDRAQQDLPRRDAHPVILYRRLPENTDDPAVRTIQDLSRMGVVSDRYVVELWGQGLKMHYNQKWPVYIMDSSRAKGSKGEPFGYLEPFPQSTSGQVYLVLLPYNYPRLAALLQEAHNAGNLSDVSQKWRPDFNQYLAQTPAYYYMPLRRALKKLGQLLASQVPESKGGGLSPAVLKRLQRAKDQVKEENQRFDSARNEHPNRLIGPGAPLLTDTGGAATTTSGGGGGGGGSTDPLLSIPASTDLLPVWERMRQQLFGPRSLTLAGLYAKGIKGCRSVCPMQRQEVRHWTLLSEVGASLVPQNPVVEMGAFTEVLRQKELLRDPTTIVPPEEDTQEALMQKYLEVNFGNPFGSTSIGGLSGSSTTTSSSSRKRARQQDEVENEAALLGPVDFANGHDGAGEGGMMIPRQGDFGEENGVGEDGRQRKRPRLQELPPLPHNKKLALRRQKAHSSLVSLGSGDHSAVHPPPLHPGATTPMVAAGSNGGGGGGSNIMPDGSRDDRDDEAEEEEGEVGQGEDEEEEGEV